MKYKKMALLSLSLLSLSGCVTANDAQPDYGQESAKIDEAIETATKNASVRGNMAASLIVLEKQYKRDSNNPTVAMNYAHALRHTGQPDRAQAVLKPFAQVENQIPGLYTEMSMVDLSLGNYKDAEASAQKAVLQNPKDFQAYQNLGIALDAQEMHIKAERAFRMGLEYWEGDPTVILNNLALNLATQGKIDEAIGLLERAKTLSPDRIEIERNLRIVRTLNERI